MREVFEEHRLLVVCAVISAVLLTAFSAMQYYGCEILKLESKWLAIAGVPLLIALFGGGYITRFKGFGVELESKLKSPVKSVTLKAMDAVSRIQGDTKESINHLYNMGEDDVKQIKMLTFISGRQDYYDQLAVMEYFRRLNQVEFVGVTKETGEFICLLPIEKLMQNCHQDINRPFDENKVSDFIHALEGNKITTKYRNETIRLTIKQSDGLIAALQKLKDNNTDRAAVVNTKKEFVGVLTEQDIEHRIAEDVLSTQRGIRSSPSAANK